MGGRITDGGAARARWRGRADRLRSRFVLPRPVRFAALAVLTAAFAAVALQLLPLHASTADLARDVRAGRAGTVCVRSDGGRAEAVWRVAPLVYARHTAPGPPAAFEARVRRLAGGPVRFRPCRAAGPSGAGLLAPALYPLHLRLSWAGWAVTALCAALLLSMTAGGTRRGTSGIAWFWTSVLTGTGLAAWLWAEPEPLLRRRDRLPPYRLPVRARRMWGGAVLAALAPAALAALVRAAAAVVYR